MFCTIAGSVTLKFCKFASFVPKNPTKAPKTQRKWLNIAHKVGFVEILKEEAVSFNKDGLGRSNSLQFGKDGVCFSFVDQ